MTNWSVSGKYFEACNCEAICPCIVFSPPTDGKCVAVLGWRIDTGTYDETDLSGLKAAMLATADGNMKDGNWRVALYTDAQANEAQTAALQAIFSGQAGGHLANLGPLIGEVLGVKSATINLVEDGKRFSLQIDDHAAATYELIEGQEGGVVQVSGHPLAPVPGVAFTIGRSEQFHFNDHGISVDVSGKNAFTANFSYAP